MPTGGLKTKKNSAVVVLFLFSHTRYVSNANRSAEIKTLWEFSGTPHLLRLLQSRAWCWRRSVWWSPGGCWRPTPGWWIWSTGRTTSSGSSTALTGRQEVLSVLMNRSWWPSTSLESSSWWTPWVRSLLQNVGSHYCFRFRKLSDCDQIDQKATERRIHQSRSPQTTGQTWDFVVEVMRPHLLPCRTGDVGSGEQRPGFGSTKPHTVCVGRADSGARGGPGPRSAGTEGGRGWQQQAPPSWTTSMLESSLLPGQHHLMDGAVFLFLPTLFSH